MSLSFSKLASTFKTHLSDDSQDSPLATPWLRKLVTRCLMLDARIERRALGDEHQETRPNLDVLNCRVRLTKQQETCKDTKSEIFDNNICNTFAVEICGTIHAPSEQLQPEAVLNISILDITAGIHNTQAVHSNIKQWQKQDSPEFCFNADLGKLPNQVTTLSDWTTVAHIQLDWLEFARKGERKLQFDISVHSRDTNEQLARSQCTCTYENSKAGFLDLQENIQRTKTLAVALSFAVAAADQKLYNCEIELIKNWAKDNIGTTDASNKANSKLDKALDKTVVFFLNGGQLNIYNICKEIAEIAPLTDRYDVLELCLHVVRAKGFASPEEVTILKDLARWLEVDTDKFQEMTEKILPLNIHQVKDVEVILGVNPDTSYEQTRKQLNKLFHRWNARVTNPNPAIRTQADQMLNLIAEARSQLSGG